MASPNLLIKKFRLIGKRKNYDLPPFWPGLNIIYGTSGTGKTMILRLIEYCFGKTKLGPIAPEVEESCTHIVLETDLNGKTVTIKRELGEHHHPIEIFYKGMEYSDGTPDETYHIKGTLKLKSISRFFFSELNIPFLKASIAPKRLDEGFSSISIRDIFKIIYTPAEELGSPYFLKMGNIFEHNKHMEAIRAVFKIDDYGTQELQVRLSKLERQRSELKRSTEEVTKFLTKNNIFSEENLSADIKKYLDELDTIHKRIQTLNENISKNSKISSDITYEILSKKENISELKEELSIIQRRLIEFNELLLLYKNKIEEKNGVLELKGLEQSQTKTCPICHSAVPSENSLDDSYIKAEIKELERKIEDLAEVIKENEYLLNSKQKVLGVESAKLTELEERNESALGSYLSPLLEERDNMLLELGRKNEILISLKEKLNIVSDYQKLSEELNIISGECENAHTELDKRRREANSLDFVKTNLSNSFAEFISEVGQPDVEHPYLDDDLIPHIKAKETDISYFNICGTGKATVMSVAYQTALLKFCLTNEALMPKLLIFDGISKGRGTNPLASAEKLDIKVLNNMYFYWKKLLNNSVAKNAQIIIVETAKPPEEVKENILVEFDKSGKDGARKGLIDDI